MLDAELDSVVTLPTLGYVGKHSVLGYVQPVLPTTSTHPNNSEQAFLNHLPLQPACAQIGDVPKPIGDTVTMQVRVL